MFDVGFSELLLLAVVALVVIGPERLPHAARVAGAWVGKIKRTLGNMQAEIEREVSAQELRERLEKEIALVREHDALSTATDEPLAVIRQGLEDARQSLAAAETGTPVDAPAARILPPAPAAAAPLPAAPLPTPADAAATTALPLSVAAAAADDAPAVDGEAAYREWLAAQKSRNLSPPAAAGNEPGHHD